MLQLVTQHLLTLTCFLFGARIIMPHDMPFRANNKTHIAHKNSITTISGLFQTPSVTVLTNRQRGPYRVTPTHAELLEFLTRIHTQTPHAERAAAAPVRARR